MFFLKKRADEKVEIYLENVTELEGANSVVG